MSDSPFKNLATGNYLTQPRCLVGKDPDPELTGEIPGAAKSPCLIVTNNASFNYIPRWIVQSSIFQQHFYSYMARTGYPATT
jgi:hypothetical protein